MLTKPPTRPSLHTALKKGSPLVHAGWEGMGSFQVSWSWTRATDPTAPSLILHRWLW